MGQGGLTLRANHDGSGVRSPPSRIRRHNHGYLNLHTLTRGQRANYGWVFDFPRMSRDKGVGIGDIAGIGQVKGVGDGLSRLGYLLKDWRKPQPCRIRYWRWWSVTVTGCTPGFCEAICRRATSTAPAAAVDRHGDGYRQAGIPKRIERAEVAGASTTQAELTSTSKVSIIRWYWSPTGCKRPPARIASLGKPGAQRRAERR